MQTDAVDKVLPRLQCSHMGLLMCFEFEEHNNNNNNNRISIPPSVVTSEATQDNTDRIVCIMILVWLGLRVTKYTCLFMF